MYVFTFFHSFCESKIVFLIQFIKTRMRITNPNLIAATAIRYAKKTFRFRYEYGEPPLLKADDFNDEARLEELKYKQIRFAALFESCSPLVEPIYERFTNLVMQGGRRLVAYRLMHDTFFEIKCIQTAKLRKEKKQLAPGEEEEEIITNPMEILKRGIKNCEPVVVVNKVKRGGAIYQVPYPIAANQSQWFAMRWLIAAVRERPKPRNKLFGEVMARELIDAAYSRGKVVKKKDDIHRLAAANKAYAHYRWG